MNPTHTETHTQKCECWRAGPLRAPLFTQRCDEVAFDFKEGPFFERLLLHTSHLLSSPTCTKHHWQLPAGTSPWCWIQSLGCWGDSSSTSGVRLFPYSVQKLSALHINTCNIIPVLHLHIKRELNVRYMLWYSNACSLWWCLAIELRNKAVLWQSFTLWIPNEIVKMHLLIHGSLNQLLV